MTSHIALAPAPVKASATALSAGTRIDRFEIEHLIAQSPRSAIYRALDRESGQVIALKEYLPNGLAARNAKGRVSARSHACAWRFELGRSAFCDEAKQLMRLRHPSLLCVLDLLQVNGNAYRVMRFTPGPTLFAHRRALARAPAAEDVERWLDGLLGALSVLHGAGLVHGDVTPDNILLRPGERALLLDFGAVQRALASPDAPAKEPCSQPRNSAWPSVPGPPSVAGDLFALAVALHYGLSGRRPPPLVAGRLQVEPMVDLWQRQYPGRSVPDDVVPRLAALDARLAGGPPAAPAPVAPQPATRPAVIVEAVPEPPAPAPQARAQAAPRPAAPKPIRWLDADESTILPPDAAWTVVVVLVLLFGVALWSMKRDAVSPASPERPAFAFANPPAESTLPPLPALPRWSALAELQIVAAEVEPPPWLRPPAIADVPRARPAPVARKKPAPAKVSSKSAAAAPTRTAPTSPRQVCGDRTGFSLYRCMQLRCAEVAWSAHAQCARLRVSDAID